jgi:hypothetical protein
MKRRYGWSPDLHDHRDYIYRPKVTKIPASVDLRAGCPAVYDQGQLGSCHDASTEVLTENGWSLFADLSGEERLASVDPKTSKLIYEKPTRVVRLPFTGDLVVGSNEQSLDFAVTPDHKMLVRKWNQAEQALSSGYTFVDAKDIGWYSGLMNRVSWAGEGSDTYTIPGVLTHKHKPQREPRQISMAVWLQFIGIYLAEGTLMRKPNNYKIQLAASKEREKGYIRSLLAELGINALELTDRFTFDNRQIYEEMMRLGFAGIRAPDKFVPEFVFKQSAENIKKCLQGHFMGDGCEQRGLRAHYTSSEQLADDIQLLVFLSGDESHISVRDHRTSTRDDGCEIVGGYPEHRVSVCERKNLSIERSESISRQDYDGEVFCAEVPTYHTLVTRRNRRILISGNCTGNAIAGAIEYDLIREAHDMVPSRLFVYYNERAKEGTVQSDAGASIRDGIKAVASLGVPPESEWPYSDANPGPFQTKPPANVYADALKYRVTSYESIQLAASSLGIACLGSKKSVAPLQLCLASGSPFVFGMTVYESFEGQQVAQDGIVPMPGPGEAVLGGHAVVGVGYDSAKGRFIVRNSWGPTWGDKGYCYLSFPYVLKFASDFWAIRTVSVP